MSVPARISGTESMATLEFARALEIALSHDGFCTDRETVYEPALISWIRPVAEFTLSLESGCFRVTVERVGEEVER